MEAVFNVLIIVKRAEAAGGVKTRVGAAGELGERKIVCPGG